MDIKKIFQNRNFLVLCCAVLIFNHSCHGQTSTPVSCEPKNGEIVAVQDTKPYTTTQKTFTFDGIHTDKDYHWYVTKVVGDDKRVHCREIRNMADLLFPNTFGKNDRIQEIQVFADLTNQNQESYVTVTVWQYKDHPEDTISLFQVHMHEAGNIQFN